MTLKGATEPEIARAVKHSMVVIDAAKHKLDYRQSEKDNGIAELKKKYQGFDDETGHHGGASTLLSRRKQDVEVPERQGSGVIDPLTGKVVYKESGRTYVDPRTRNVYDSYGVSADNVTTSGQMTFRCDTTPTVDLSVFIIRLEVGTDE